MIITRGFLLIFGTLVFTGYCNQILATDATSVVSQEEIISKTHLEINKPQIKSSKKKLTKKVLLHPFLGFHFGQVFSKSTMSSVSSLNQIQVKNLDKSLKSNDSISFGIRSNIPVIKYIAIQPEFFYLRKGFSEHSTAEYNGNRIDYTVDLNIYYLEISSLIRTQYSNSTEVTPYFLLGPSLGFKIDESVTIDTYGNPGIEKKVQPNLFSSNDFSLIAGIGINFDEIIKNVGFFLEGRYQYGFTDIINDNSRLGREGITLHNRTIMIISGMTIALL